MEALTSATLHGSPDRDWTYECDPIGNRVAASQPVGLESVYVSNALNQYGAVGRDGSPAVSEGARYDADGNLIEIFVAGDMNCDNQIDNGDIDPFIDALIEGPPYTDYYTAYPGCNVLNGDLNGDNVFDNGDGDAFTALLVGAGGGSAQKATLAWDAENRLVAWTPGGKLDSSSRRLAFDYDWMGRRIRKTTYAWDEGEEDWEATPATDIKYVWDGWLLLMELDALDDDAPIRKYTWGLDLAGLGGASASSRSDDGRTSAGGIGGLLALEDAGTSSGYGYFFDGNGNVGQVVKPSDGTISAKYQYDPYGNIIDDPDTLDQPMRFSTKPLDAETGFYYYGYRYYMPKWGRWESGDPAPGRDGWNLYRYTSGNPSTWIDSLGLNTYCGPSPLGPITCDKNEVGDVGGCPPHYVPPRRKSVTVRPGWLWGLQERDPCNAYPSYEYGSSTEFYSAVMEQPAAKAALTASIELLLSRVRGACADICTCGDAARSQLLSTTVVQGPLNSVGLDWMHIGRFRVTSHLRCSVWSRNCRCNACCSVTHEVWDDWHWRVDIPDPMSHCPTTLNRFFWYLAPIYEVFAASLNCNKLNATFLSTP